MSYRSTLVLLAALALGACANPPLTATMPSASPSGATPAPSASTDSGLNASLGATGTVTYTQVPGVKMPPWPAPTNVADLVKAAHLDQLTSEGSFEHIHQHLDVFYNGKPVTVPAYIGIDPLGNFISPLHTHTDEGTLHIESPTNAVITLGQFFTEWDVPLTGATAYVDGKQAADPAAIVLANHQEIAVVYGTPPATIPSFWNGTWPDGTSASMPAVPASATATP